MLKTGGALSKSDEEFRNEVVVGPSTKSFIASNLT